MAEKSTFEKVFEKAISKTYANSGRKLGSPNSMVSACL